MFALRSLATLAFALSAVSAAVAAPLAAQSSMADHDMKAHVVNTNGDGVAIHGYDPVAYFVVGQPTKGEASLSAEFQGATYHFSNVANRALFTGNPEKYAPQYGGYCAMGLVGGRKFDVDPMAWRVEDGKLYLNKDPGVQKMWLRDVPGNIVKADEKWPTITP